MMGLQHDETISVGFGGSFFAASECSFLGTDRSPDKISVGVDCDPWYQSDHSFSDSWTGIPFAVLPGKSRTAASHDWPTEARLLSPRWRDNMDGTICQRHVYIRTLRR
jgi:hypothetical protein